MGRELLAAHVGSREEHAAPAQQRQAAGEHRDAAYARVPPLHAIHALPECAPAGAHVDRFVGLQRGRPRAVLPS